MTAPMMRMGLIGFSDEQYLLNLLMTRNRVVRWQSSPVAEADALWVNGMHVTPIRGSFIRVPSGQPDKAAISLNLQEIDRPIAFTLPISPQFSAPLTFDPRSVESVSAILRAFELELNQATLELALGEEIARRRYDLRSSVFHLTLRGALVGIVTATGEVGLLPGLSGGDLSLAEWSGRPAAADAMPATFSRTTIARIMWRYVGRSDDDLLPPRYRQVRIYFRRMPSVSQRLIKDAHLAVISELGTMAQSVEQLAMATGMGDRQLSQVLGALYFAGAITTDARRAAAGVPGSRGGEGPASDINSDLSEDGGREIVPARPGRRARGPGPSTVPTPLEPKR